MAIDKSQIEAKLAEVVDPNTETDLVAGKAVKAIEQDGESWKIEIQLGYPASGYFDELKQEINSALGGIAGLGEVEVTVSSQVKSHAVQQNLKPLQGIKNVIAVASGKGGVGKSTVAANLAVALAQSGNRVGLIDADVYGPSVPKMFDVEGERPTARTEEGVEWIIPIEKYKVKLLSVGLFVSPEDAVIWRGPMATSALKQLITQGDWGELDILLIDLPPGTGDVHLTMVQEVPVTGVVIVSTPQDVALADVIKGINMFTGDKINVPVLGLVENMSWFTPEELPDKKYYIFGKEGCKKLAKKMGIPLLGQVPIVQGIRESGDSGLPAALSSDTLSGDAFRQLSEEVEKALNKRNEKLEPTRKVEITTK